MYKIQKFQSQPKSQKVKSPAQFHFQNELAKNWQKCFPDHKSFFSLKKHSHVRQINKIAFYEFYKSCILWDFKNLHANTALEVKSVLAKSVFLMNFEVARNVAVRRKASKFADILRYHPFCLLKIIIITLNLRPGVLINSWNGNFYKYIF